MHRPHRRDGREHQILAYIRVSNDSTAHSTLRIIAQTLDGNAGVSGEAIGAPKPSNMEPMRSLAAVEAAAEQINNAAAFDEAIGVPMLLTADASNSPDAWIEPQFGGLATADASSPAASSDSSMKDGELAEVSGAAEMNAAAQVSQILLLPLLFSQ